MQDNITKQGIGMRKNILYTIGIITTLFLLFGCNVQAYATQQKKVVAVISDVGHRNGTNYLICGAASDIIASDIVNRINMTNTMSAPLLGETMAQITRKSIPLYYVTFFNEYKYNYNIDFINLKRVTKTIPADYFLMVTSGLDVQSGFLKDTWWNKLNVAGMDPVKPTYKLATLITLIDKNSYNILWQDMYVRDIEAHNYDLGIVQFSPSYQQLSKIKKYSKNLSEYVTKSIDKKITPVVEDNQKQKSIEMKSGFINEGTKFYYPSVNGEVVKQNIHQIKDSTQKKWYSFKREREQKKYIENVRKLQLQQEQSENTQKVVPAVAKKTKKINKKEEQKLFDSIRNNIDDVSNSLPAPRKDEEKYVIPVNNLQAEPIMNQENMQEQVEKQPSEKVQDVKPATLKTPKEPIQGSVQENAKPQNGTVDSGAKKPVEPLKEQLNKPLKKEYYDWNIKNKHLQKIGSYT